MNVACVLRSGGPYGPGYVLRLQKRVAEHLAMPHDFVCLTDMDVPDVDTVPLEHGWFGWWSKIELFRPDVFSGRVLYLDLDTEVVKSLDDIASYGGRFAMIDDWIHQGHGASGVMLWDAGTAPVHDIYGPFARNPKGAIQSHRGDQNWISDSVEWDALRQLYPGQIVSRWEECRDTVPPNARIVCYHGTPKPHKIGWSLTGSRKQELRRIGAM